MIQHILYAARGNAQFYNEVTVDGTYQSEGYIVVVVVNMGSALLTVLSSMAERTHLIAAIAFGLLVFLFGMLAYVAWSFTVYALETRVLGNPVPFRDIRRVLAFAFVPHILSFVQVLPAIGPFLGVAISLWSGGLFYNAMHRTVTVDKTRYIAATILGSMVLTFVAFFSAWLTLAVGLILEVPASSGCCGRP